MSPPPSSPPPPPVPAPSFSYPSLITTRVHSYTWYTRVSQNNFLRQNIWHSNLLFSAALRPCIFATPSAKNALLFSTVHQLENFSCSFVRYNFFHPYLMNANYLCRRIFGTSLFNPSRRASGFTREGGRRGEHR